MDLVHPSNRAIPRRKPVGHNSVGGDRERVRRVQVLVLLLLAGILCVAELAKTGTYVGLPTLTRRFLRLSRIGEPCQQHTGAPKAVATFLSRYIHSPQRVALAPACAQVDTFRLSLTVFDSLNPFRSPPEAA